MLRIKSLIKSIPVFLFIFTNIILFGQDLKIIKIDNKDYPILKIIVQTNDIIKENDFNILLDNKLLKYSIDTLTRNSINTQKNIFFLIEYKDSTTKNISRNKFNQIKNAIKNIGRNTKINIAFANIKDSLVSVKVFAPEFSDNYNFFIEELDYLSETAFTDTLLKRYKYLEPSFFNDNIKNGTNKKVNKALIIISDSYRLLGDTLSANTLIENLIKNDICTYFINTNSADSTNDHLQVNLCEATAGIYTKVSIPKIKKTLQKYFNDISLSAKIKKEINYRLILELPSERKNNFFYLQYKNEKNVLPIKKTNTIYGFPVKAVLIIISLSSILLLLLSLFIGTKRSLHHIRKKQIPEPEKPVIKDLDRTRTMRGTEGIVPILIVDSGNFRKTYELNKKKTTIGRDESNNVVIPDTTISGFHAEIYYRNNSFYIKDLESTNGIIINDNKISEKKLNSGDILKIGNVLLKIRF